jgi:hypothetical protein
MAPCAVAGGAETRAHVNPQGLKAGRRPFAIPYRLVRYPASPGRDLNSPTAPMHRPARKTDRRVTEAVVTEKGQAMSEMLDAARERLAGKALASWSEEDLVELARLLRRFADNLMQAPGKP